MAVLERCLAGEGCSRELCTARPPRVGVLLCVLHTGIQCEYLSGLGFGTGTMASVVSGMERGWHGEAASRGSADRVERGSRWTGPAAWSSLPTPRPKEKGNHTGPSPLDRGLGGSQHRLITYVFTPDATVPDVKATTHVQRRLAE